MHARVRLGVFVGAAFLLGTGGLTGQGQFGQPAPDFPPGIFTDGNPHQLGDYKGKVVVLYFFENK